jgi:hypothetical protein
MQGYARAMAQQRKSRRGRPELAPEARREHRVVVMVTRRELEGLKRLAAAEGTSVSTAAHRILTRSLRRRGET